MKRVFFIVLVNGLTMTTNADRSSAKMGDGPRLKRDLTIDIGSAELRASVVGVFNKGGTAAPLVKEVYPLSVDLAAASSFLPHLEMGIEMSFALVNAGNGSFDASRLLTGAGGDDRGTSGRQAVFAPPDLYALWQFASLADGTAKLGVRVDIRFPSGNASDVGALSKMGVGVAVPSRWVFSDMIGLEATIGVGAVFTEGAATKSISVLLAPVVQPTDELYFQLIFGASFTALSTSLFSTDSLAVPLAFQVGIQLSKTIDWYLNWSFENLRPDTATESLDKRRVFTGINVRLGL